jgi:hypothetical protein
VRVTCDDDVPPPVTLECQRIPSGAVPHTLRCAGERAVVEVPWQGAAVDLRFLPFDGLGGLGADEDGFAPLSLWPLLHVGVVAAGGDEPIVEFDPPLRLTVDYDAADFAAATPTPGEGELGVGVWDTSASAWIVLGYGAFHNGFWVADPIGSETLVLENDPSDLQPRFQMTGGSGGGSATALIARSLPTLPVSLGALPPDPERMVKEFDAGCRTLASVGAVECVSEAVGVTVRVPFQENGAVTPLVLAVPWNRTETMLPTEVDDPRGNGTDVTVVERSLMNFVVVDAAEPTRVLTEFDPPIEFELRYTFEDRDPDLRDWFRVNYWDEYAEQLVVLAEGETANCIDGESGEPNPGCLWGFSGEAVPTEAFYGAFFQEEEDGGVARFRYDAWGDRMIAFGR